jgi:deoxyribonuclease-4
MKKKLLIGAHMSISGGVFNSLTWGRECGCATIQIFTKSNNQWRAKELSELEVKQFEQNQKETGIAPVVAHNSYLINLGSPDKILYEKSKEAMLIELQRAEKLSLPYLVMHPGSHIGDGEDRGLKRIASAINWLIEKTKDFKVMLLLETTAGQGSNLGYKFEQLAEIIDLTENKKRIGVCYDTCHTFTAGYELRKKEGYEKTFKDFDKIIGLKNLKVIHLNDSKKELGSKIDRHEHIGKGFIGLEGFKLIMNDKKWENVPKILETPKDEGLESDKKNLKALMSLVK